MSLEHLLLSWYPSQSHLLRPSVVPLVLYFLRADSSGSRQAWGFTLAQFARIYGRKFGVPEDKMLQRLWGDNYFLPSEKKWTMAGDPQIEPPQKLIP